jgi:signal transduction histidine kinase
MAAPLKPSASGASRTDYKAPVPLPVTETGDGVERESTGGLGGAFASLPHTGFVLVGADERIEEATPTACDLLGAGDLAALQRQWGSLAAQLGTILDARDGAADIALEVEGRRRQLRCEVHGGADGSARGYLVLVRPVMRTGPLELALQLASRYQTVSALQASIAHELRSSLNALVLNVELLGRTLDGSVPRSDDAPLRAHCLKVIRRELDHVSQFFGRVLDLARPDRGERGRVALATVLESVVSLLRKRAERHRATIELEIADPWLETLGDEGELRHALLGLASDALETVPAGGTLTASLVAQGPAAEISIFDADTASSELRSRVWDLYLSGMGDPSAGLSAARSIVTSFDGSITLDRRARGARVTVRLPLVR